MTNNTDTPTVVLVHGGFADASYWTPVIQELQASGVLPVCGRAFRGSGIRVVAGAAFDLRPAHEAPDAGYSPASARTHRVKAVRNRAQPG